MGLPIPSPLIEYVLLGAVEDRRQLQDSPILGDVWVAFAAKPAKAHDLLIAPYRGEHAGDVAAAIDDDIKTIDKEGDAEVSYLQGIIAAKLTLNLLLRVVVPKTKWWLGCKHTKEEATPVKRGKHLWQDEAPAIPELASYSSKTIEAFLRALLEEARAWNQKISLERSAENRFAKPGANQRFAALCGLILWAGAQTRNSDEQTRFVTADGQIEFILSGILSQLSSVAEILREIFGDMASKKSNRALVYQVSANRRPHTALTLSVPAVKADAAKRLFKVDCRRIGWAIVDSGIDGAHPAFLSEDGESCRIRASYDLSQIRKIISLSNLRPVLREKNATTLLDRSKRRLLQPPAKPLDDLQSLAEAARCRAPVRWDLVEPFVRIWPDAEPPASHGTHVAGIIGACAKAALEKNPEKAGDSNIGDGMCPDISLYDFRVLAQTQEDTEFAIIAALQFIRYLNERDNLPSIHGANLSLSIRHDVRNYACGRTPICDECERLVESGVVVVAAAGNQGRQTFQTADGTYEGYTAFSISDPGNADSILTVGATHRFWPHTYGVSFFSSRGPTGDGRLKPDLVAPGEKIHAPLPNGEWGDLDGTSMAAPHVSGAAAMLMARYSEFVGRPRKIKQILCDTATDLGRERTFQGHGMLDVLRAFQSI